MNRRHLLQAMLSVPVLGAIGGCRRDHRSALARGGTVKVILQGPFAFVLDTREHYRIKAFVPFDEDNLHEFRFRDPHDPPISGEGDPARRNRYQFTLLDHNLEISAKPRHIDSGFDDVTLHVNGWQPSPNDYFVALDLPAPDLISYIPPAIPVVMAGAGAPRLAMMPTNHVLEYRVRDLDDIGKITLRSPQLGDRQPVSCADLLGGFREHWHAT